MRVDISVKAKGDLRNIALFIAADNPKRAMSFYEELHIASKELADFAERYPVVRQHKKFQIRRRNYGRYIIYFRLEPKRVLVIRVVHGAMDQDQILKL